MRRRRCADARRLRAAAHRRGCLRAGGRRQRRRREPRDRRRVRLQVVQHERIARCGFWRVRGQDVAAARRVAGMRGHGDPDRRGRTGHVRPSRRGLSTRDELSHRRGRGRGRRRGRVHSAAGVPGGNARRGELLPADRHPRWPDRHSRRRGSMGGAGSRGRWWKRLALALPPPGPASESVRGRPARRLTRCPDRNQRARRRPRRRRREHERGRQCRRRKIRVVDRPYFRVGDIPRRRLVASPCRRPRTGRGWALARSRGRGGRHGRGRYAVRTLARPRRRGQRRCGRARSDVRRRTGTLKLHPTERLECYREERLFAGLLVLGR